ncbi:uncharacterized protein LOC130138729 [Syzygium oleosum]|uniref:uncharacterized protein LOC130138729 n=1 Tax=Syzygium oleosum TaxID=219896 RepID=UPI0024B9FF04|nr:uncharacterized protein LOC130138729 [Syzygium oleosum]
MRSPDLIVLFQLNSVISVKTAHGDLITYLCRHWQPPVDTETPEGEQTVALEGEHIAASLAEPVDSSSVLVNSPSSDSSTSELDLPIAHTKEKHCLILAGKQQ